MAQLKRVWAEDEEENEEHTVIERKDTEKTARVKIFEVMARVQRVEENACNQKARQGKEEINTDPAGAAKSNNKVQNT
jgi:hypothetical protein